MIIALYIILIRR